VREAQRIIDSAPKHGPLEPIKYADALPESASDLANLLRSEEMIELTDRYRDCDWRAMRAQTWHNLLTQTAALAGFAAGILVGVDLFLGVRVARFR
jgi:hypothetical protein